MTDDNFSTQALPISHEVSTLVHEKEMMEPASSFFVGELLFIAFSFTRGGRVPYYLEPGRKPKPIPSLQVQ